ncbi:hypothetical protein Dsin_024401 [Dipteronia sinensis]|uniref:Uncharacterized protein n=1 Tax=Dipteronia sinensis TaxID=43782 RepID=A0AAD9ZU55_9ROSI|nr:hypothetical protein Dsin_024401 [Dipteronia sinensis]
MTLKWPSLSLRLFLLLILSATTVFSGSIVMHLPGYDGAAVPGPMEFDVDNYTGGLPKLKYYPYAWTKTASIIFADSPVGTGFSYSTTQQGWYSSDTDSAEQAYLFLTKE